jgi:hypothetical protein
VRAYKYVCEYDSSLREGETKERGIVIMIMIKMMLMMMRMMVIQMMVMMTMK